ncbi:MAG: hypothetical protein Q8M92_01120, partial [Candidatus Subteraquimicrobiales bacterium]|nr:hypothetical protein [Candidatus Subteraquimicrobiales bacterium]
MSQEEKFIKELKELTFGIHKSGRSYGARMFRNFKDEYEARKAQKNLQSLGSIDERNNHYQLKIYEKEVRTLLTKYLPEIIDGKEEVLSQIIIDYDFLSQDVPCHRKDERKLLYDRLWEFRHPNLTKPEESPTLLE